MRAASAGRADMRGWRLLSLAVLFAFVVSVAGDFEDFDLVHALATTKQPVPPKKPPPDYDDDFSLEHALHPDDPKPSPPANPRDTDKPKHGPRAPADTGDFDDKDLLDNSSPGGGGGSSGGSNERKDSGPNKVEESDASQGAIAGIVSAVVATVIGAVSSFIAYQKKKLCFKQSDEENVNMDSHRGAQSEPPVQRTLLEN